MKPITLTSWHWLKYQRSTRPKKVCSVSVGRYVIDYFGSKARATDTKIGFDGVQRVHGGDGF